MGGTGKKSEPPKKDEGRSKGSSKELSKGSPPVPPVEDDDAEDGDMATPKRDRHGNDDEPL